MKNTETRQEFIDRTARKPYGEEAVRNYTDPKGHYRGFQDILAKLDLSRNDRYFEIGCGGGVLLKMALDRVEYAAAIDHSSDMAELSIKNNLQAVKEKKAEISVGDAVDLPWDDESFTAGAAAHMFFFVRQPVEMLKEVHRVLKRGGRFAMVTMGKGPVGKLIFGNRYRLLTYGINEMESMFRTAGFSVVDVRTVRSQILFRHQLCYAIK